MNHSPECFGGMFPNVLDLPSDQNVAGKVFTVRLEKAGGLMRSGRKITVDEHAWKECQTCPAFDECYKFCMAKMALSAAIIPQ